MNEDEGKVFLWKKINTTEVHDKAVKPDVLPKDHSADDPYEVDEEEGESRSGCGTVASVIFYFTHEAAHRVESMEAYAGELIAEANEGFANSNIPLSVRIHCIELSDIKDGQDSDTMLRRFKGVVAENTDVWYSAPKTRKSADIAMLVVVILF